MDSGTAPVIHRQSTRSFGATKFVTSGFTTPTVTIAITSNDGKRNEKAEFAKDGGRLYRTP